MQISNHATGRELLDRAAVADGSHAALLLLLLWGSEKVKADLPLCAQSIPSGDVGDDDDDDDDDAVHVPSFAQPSPFQNSIYKNFLTPDQPPHGRPYYIIIYI